MRIWVHGFGNSSGTGTPAPPFNDPSDIVGIQEWWNTGAGVSETANVVNSWTGQINSTVLTTTGGTGMTYNSSDSNVNNQPSFINNGTKAVVTNSNITSFTPTTARSVFFVAKPNLVGDGSNNFMGGQGGNVNPPSYQKFYTSGIYSDSADKLGIYSQPGGPNPSGIATQNQVLTYIITIPNTTSFTHEIKFKGSSAVSVNKTGLTDLDLQSPLEFEAGGWGGVDLFNGTIMECGFVNGVMSATDISNLQTYVDNKY